MMSEGYDEGVLVDVRYVLSRLLCESSLLRPWV